MPRVLCNVSWPVVRPCRNKDKGDKLEEKLCCRGDAKMMKRKKKQEKMKKAEEEFNRLKAELSSCSDSDSDTDTTD